MMYHRLCKNPSEVSLPDNVYAGQGALGDLCWYRHMICVSGIMAAVYQSEATQ